MAVWQNSVPRCNVYNISFLSMRIMLQHITLPAYWSVPHFSSTFHHLSPTRLFLKTKQPSLQLTVIVTSQCVWNIKKAWSHLLIMPLITITKFTKESTSITALCETYLSWFKGRTRLEFCAKLWKWPQFHGKWYSTIDFTRRITETFNFKHWKHNSMHSQNSSFKIWRDANILLHNELENT